MEDGSYKMMS